MHIEWIYSFIQAAQTQSLSKASDQLNLSQPALSKQMRALESTLGSHLFHRSPQGVSLTEAGEIALSHFKIMIADWEQLQAKLQAHADSHLMRIGTLPSLASTYLPAKLLAAPFPTEVHVKDNSQQLIDLLQDRNLDIIFIDLPTKKKKVVVHQPIFTEPLYLIVPHNHPLSSMTSVKYIDLIGHPFVLYPHGCDIRFFIEHTFAKLKENPQITLESSYGESILGYVRAGVGITILPQLLADELKQDKLKVIPFDEADATRTISMVSFERHTLNKMSFIFKGNGESL
ncbi:LysR family transcriptional regulator [Mechercharimyces sp. CAU 1602]|uniref:LysR family transcriptional regulator n=1 Tax=Mechercharimyces sp. CAU 1602 TaxID=2973933 RepID=UPI002163EA18|nr:LysR family transcriptional regulator [Mechercharimyces sp. CAU 1602]MCS1352732.1 LysR family transcriptional regulator [Mechercharimyces sp. CAU 1602]